MRPHTIEDSLSGLLKSIGEANVSRECKLIGIVLATSLSMIAFAVYGLRKDA